MEQSEVAWLPRLMMSRSLDMQPLKSLLHPGIHETVGVLHASF
jgi:hypothetical protein